MPAQGSGTVTGTVGGTTANHKPEQAGPSFGDRGDFVEFFGGVSFDGSGTLDDLLKSDEPPSPGTMAANKRWLQTPHPEHFFKESDGFVEEENIRKPPPLATSFSPTTSGLAVNKTLNRAASDARGTRKSGLFDPGFARHGEENLNGRDLVRGTKRQRQSTIMTAKGVATKEARAGGALGRGGTRRRDTCSASVLKVLKKEKDSEKNDPMKKRLEEYKRSVKVSSSTPAEPSERRAREGCGGAKANSTVTASRIRSTRSVNTRKAPSTSSRGGLGVAGAAPAVPSVGTGTAGAKRPAVRRVAASANARGASAEGSTKNVSSMKRFPRSAPTATEIMTAEEPAKYVSRPMRTVKRSVGGAAAGRGRGRDRAIVGELGRGSTGDNAGGQSRGPVKRARNGPGPVGGRGGGFGVGNRGKFAARPSGPALVLDAELEARLAAHNKDVTKGKHTYEPKRSIRDCRMWEAKTGKVYMSLMVDERIEANKEIDAMRAAIRDEAFPGH